MWSLANQASLIAAICSTTAAIAVLLRGQQPLRGHFSALSLSVAGYYGMGLLARMFYESVVVDCLTLIAGGCTILSLTSLFDAMLAEVGLSPSKLRPAMRAGAGCIIALGFTPLAAWFWIKAGVLALALGLLTVHITGIWQRAGRVPSPADRARLRTLAYAGALTLITVVLDAASTFYWAIPPLGGFAVSVYIYFISQTLVVSHLLDLHELLSRVGVFASLALTLAGVHGLLILWAGGPGLFWFNTLVGTSVTLILFEPLRSFLDTWARALFFRKHIAFARDLRQTNRALATFVEVEPAIAFILDRLYESKRTTHAAVYLLDPDRWDFVLQAHRGKQPVDHIGGNRHPVLFRHVLHASSPLLREDVRKRLRQHKGASSSDAPATARWQGMENQALLQGLASVHGDLLIPLRGPDSVVGFLSLRDERVREVYGKDEIAALMQLGEQLAITVQNSRVFASLKERDRLAALGEMSAGLAHEIRNPLGAIKGAAQTLDPSHLEGEEADLLRIIVSEVNRLNKVVAEFLDYARPFQTPLAPVDLNKVVEHTVRLMRHDLPKQVTLTSAPQPRLPLIWGDADQLCQVLINLLVNAKEAVGERGVLHVWTRVLLGKPSQGVAGNRVQIGVQDSGPGIKPHLRDKIFIPFFTTKEKGSGLGLALGQRIVRHHQGHIYTRPAQEKGAAFIIELPVRQCPDR
ncbi:MAG: ATP-binding protein [Myxococcota bacterium]